mgnify:CR=1 FL=1
MKKQICLKILVSVSLLVLSGCGFLEEEDNKTTDNVSYTNTLDQSLGGNQGDINDYFYNFDTDVEGKLIRRRGKRLRQLVEYEDTEETQRMELMLYAYNSLLHKTYIDIATLEKPYIERENKVGRQRIAINQNNKFVSRIFSRGSWTNNGWFYGGFWQQLSRNYRKDIFIDNSDNILKVLDNYSKNLEEIKNAIKNKDSKKLLEIFSSTKKVRKEIIEAGQDTDKPGFGRN